MDKTKFQPIFLAMCEMYDKEISKELTQMYFSVLEDAGLSDEDFERASKHLLATYKYKNIPKPADFISAVSGDPEAQALFAIQDLEKAMRDHGAYASVTFQDPILGEIVNSFDGGWIGLCESTLDEFTWIKKDFIKLYSAKLSSGNYRREPVALIGRHEDSGNTNVKPVLIGTSDQKLLIERDNKYPVKGY